MTREDDARAVLKRIEDAQAALRRMLKAVEPSRLAQRPPFGDWSPMENVRHLVFAEQHHFGPYLERGFRWSSAGVPPPNRTGERRLSPVGNDPAATIDDVFEAWANVHAVVRKLCIDAPGELTEKLGDNLRHVSIHTATIERLLRG
jgi:hypothetical protein